MHNKIKCRSESKASRRKGLRREVKRKASVDRHRIVVVDSEYMSALALVDAVIVTVAFAIRTKQKRVLVVALGASDTVINFGKFFLG